jgi:hypothetical protein
MNMNGLIDTRKEFEKSIKETMLQIAVDTYHNRVDVQAYTKILGLAHEKFFNSMKGATNVHTNDVEELIESEIRRQKALYKRLEALEPFFDTVKPLNPSDIYASAHWDHGPSYGCNVEINRTRFYALPRVPCSTTEYITVKQAPIPANIVKIDQDMILMLPYSEDPSEETRKQLNKMLTASGQVNEEGIEDPIKIRENYLWVNSEQKLDERLIISLIEKYKADAIMVGYPGRNLAIIYTGLEESIERLWKTIYFDWDDTWRRYGWYE